MSGAECVPPVIESPKSQTTNVSDGAMTSTASRKNHDVVVYSKANTSRSSVCRVPAPARSARRGSNRGMAALRQRRLQIYTDKQMRDQLSELFRLHLLAGSKVPLEW